MPDKIEFNESQKSEIIRLYTEEKIPAKQIGDCFGVSHNIIRRTLSAEGILRPRNKYHCNCEIFNKIDTEAKAYWLGFLYADGCITKGNVLTVSLCWKDHEHLEKLQVFLETDQPVKRYSNRSSPSDRAVFYLSNNEICCSLNNLGCIPRKTLALQFPSIEQVPEHLVSHFMRGYFDGDGSVYQTRQTRKNKTGYKTYESIGMNVTGCKEFIETYKSHLPFTGLFKVYDCKNKLASYISVGGKFRLNLMYHFFYDDASVFLDRKQEVFEQLLTASDCKRFP